MYRYRIGIYALKPPCCYKTRCVPMESWTSTEYKFGKTMPPNVCVCLAWLLVVIAWREERRQWKDKESTLTTAWEKRNGLVTSADRGNGSDSSGNKKGHNRQLTKRRLDRRCYSHTKRQVSVYTTTCCGATYRGACLLLCVSKTKNALPLKLSHILKV